MVCLTIKKITVLSAVCLFALLLSGCGGQGTAESKNAESSTLSVVEESSEVTVAEQIDESSEPVESSGDTSVYDSNYTVDQYGVVRDALGFQVSQIDPETYEGSITYIEDESSEDEDSEELNYDDYSYEIVDEDEKKVIQITGYNGNDTNLVIPEKIDDMPVCYIGEKALSGNKNLLSVTIPKSVKIIKNYAFYECSNLKNVIFQEDSELTNLYSFSFAATPIEEFTVPKSCQDVSDPFQMCYELKKLTILGMDTRVYIDMILPKDCVVYGYKNSIAHKKLFSIYGFTFKVIDE